MIRPLTAMTVFLPTVESQTVRAMDGLRSVRVARAMARTLGPEGLIGPRHGPAHSIGHGYRGRMLAHAVPAAPVLRGGRRDPALHPGRRAGPCRPAVAVAADQGAGAGAGRRAVQPGPRQHRAHRRGRGAAAAGPPHPGRRRHRPARGAGAGPAAARPGPAGRDAQPVHRPAARTCCAPSTTAIPASSC